MPQEFAVFLPPQTRDGALAPANGGHPGSPASGARSDGHVRDEGAQNALNQPPGAQHRRRVQVVDGRGPPEAPDADDFAPAPLVPANRRKRGRPAAGQGRQVPAAVEAGDAQRGGGVQRRGRGRGRGRGGRGRGAEHDRLLRSDNHGWLPA